MQQLVDVLHSGNHSLVVANGEIRTFDRRGVADLYALLTEEPAFLRGASVTDKVVGKGAAALMILGGVAALHTDVISEPALALLAKSNVKISFVQRVPHIINREGTCCCPVETLCRDCLTAEECLQKIKIFVNAKK